MIVLCARWTGGAPVTVRHFVIDTDAGSDDAVALIMAVRNSGVQVEAVTVVAGNVPLTNLALALQREPAIAGLVREVYVMGGTAGAPGNVTAVAEYNIWADPEAARQVFHSGLPITTVGWEIAVRHGVLTDDEAEQLLKIGTRRAQFAVECNRTLRRYCREVTRIEGIDLADPVAMAIALDHSIMTRSAKKYVDVETGGELKRGQTVVDFLGISGCPPNVRVCLEADGARFKEMLFDVLQ